MNSGLEFHDSIVSSVQSSYDVVRVVFERAYLHRSEGVPGSDKGTGWGSSRVRSSSPLRA